MTETEPPAPRSWLIDRPLTGPALPRGRLARLWGWLLQLNNEEQREVFAAAGVQPGERVLEVGHGPGVLLEMLARSGARVSGVDPSEPMVEVARRRLAKAGTDPSAIRAGTAERTGFPDRSFDVVLSVNNVPMWSDLASGLAELRRVLAPGGRLVVSWHGGRRPRWLVKKLILPEPVLDRILEAIRETFGNGERELRDHVVLFRAVRR